MCVGKMVVFPTKHSAEERRASRNRFNTEQEFRGKRHEFRDYAAFLADFEGDGDEEQASAFYTAGEEEQEAQEEDHESDDQYYATAAYLCDEAC